jgi:membrane-associated phospholipid phosphatase
LTKSLKIYKTGAMSKFFRKIIDYRNTQNDKMVALFKDRSYFVSFIVGFILLFAGQIVTFKVASYNDEMFDTVTVGDLLLEILPTVDLTFFYTWGSLIFLISVAVYTLFVRIELAPWAMKTFGVLFMVRALFMVLTHLGPPEGMFYLLYPPTMEDKFLFSHFFFLNDLFFSGHVANAFLGALIFRNYKFKWYCLIVSIVMAATVLLMKMHYTIDVLAAYFVTYGIYALSDRLFHKYNERFKKIIEKKTKFRFKEPYHPEVPALG